MNEKPVVILHFDNLVYKKGRQFKGIDTFLSSNNIKDLTVPPPTLRIRKLLKNIKGKYTIILYSDNNFFYALAWVFKNRLQNNPIDSVCRTVCRCLRSYGKFT